MKIPFVDLKAQYDSIKDEIDQAVLNVINDTAFILGKYVNAFEENFASAIGVNHCIGVGNGTDALFISLRTMGIDQGDEVIVPANSFIATSEAITAAGAKVVFADIDPATYNIDINRIEDKITSKTKALIPTHLYGQPADMTPILEIARKYNLFVIEDAAQAHLAEYKGKKAGSIGDMACFSFYPGKNLGAYGDAGAIVTNNEEWAGKARMIANRGRTSKYDHEFEGMNSRMDGLQGAILNVKLKYLPKWTENRQNAAAAYDKYLKEIQEIITPEVLKDVRHVYHLYVIRVKKRDELQEFLKSEGISTGIHYPIALPNLSAYKYLGHTPSDFPVSSRYQNEILSLPIYPELKEEHIQYIADCIKRFC